jgi:Recombination endonuclease VII
MSSVLEFRSSKAILTGNDQKRVAVRNRRVCQDLDGLNAALSYDPEAGVFIWKIRVADGCPVGSVAGCTLKGGQRQIVYRGVSYAASHLAWAIQTGVFPQRQIAYRNGDCSDLRFVNLKESGRGPGRELTLERAREVLNYSPETGQFSWIGEAAHCRRKVGRIVLESKGGGHLSIKIDGWGYMAQRVAWLLVKGEFPVGQIEPLNKDRTDLRIENWAIRRLPSQEKKRRRGVLYTAWRTANPDKVKANNLRLCFGMNYAEYRRMHDAQCGLCAICHNPETQIRAGKVQWLAVDHCHVTSVNRQLLCAACNKGLGHFLDDPSLLEKAAAYLRRHTAKPASPQDRKRA